jgi:hypothetical protein
VVKAAFNALKLLFIGTAGLMFALIAMVVLGVLAMCAWDWLWPRHPSDEALIASFQKDRGKFARLEEVCTTTQILLPADNPECQKLAEALEFQRVWTNLVGLGPVEKVMFYVSFHSSGFNIIYPLWSYNSVKGYVYLPATPVPADPLETRAFVYAERVLPAGAVGHVSFRGQRSVAVFPRLGRNVRNLADEEIVYRSVGDGWYLFYGEFPHR